MFTRRSTSKNSILESVVFHMSIGQRSQVLDFFYSDLVKVYQIVNRFKIGLTGFLDVLYNVTSF